MIDAKKMMRVIGGEHDGATVEVEDYTFAIRLPLPMSATAGDDEAQRFALYYRASISLEDDDGSLHQVEFLRAGTVSVREAVMSRLAPDNLRVKAS